MYKLKAQHTRNHAWLGSLGLVWFPSHGLCCPVMLCAAPCPGHSRNPTTALRGSPCLSTALQSLLLPPEACHWVLCEIPHSPQLPRETPLPHECFTKLAAAQMAAPLSSQPPHKAAGHKPPLLNSPQSHPATTPPQGERLRDCGGRGDLEVLHTLHGDQWPIQS